MGFNAAQNPESAPAGPCTLTGRLMENHPYVGAAIGAAMWVLAVTVLTLYARGVWITSDLTFVLGETWLVGLGCVGQPMMTLYLLGAEPSPRACERVATGAYTAAGLVTVLLACGQMHVTVLIAAFLLILPLAFAIQAGNAAQALSRRAHDRASAAAEGEERSWLACALAIGQARQTRDAKIQSLIGDAESTAELRYDLKAFAEAIEARHAPQASVIPLRVNGANGSDRQGKHA